MGDRFLWALFGPSGSGKTYLWRQHLQEMTSPRIVLDRMEHLTDLGVEVESVEHFRKTYIRIAQGELPQAKNNCFVVSWATKANGTALFDLARSAGLAATYVADEVYKWYPQRGSRDENLEELLMEGRKQSQSLVCTARKPQKVGKDILDECVLTAFRMQGKHSAERVADYFPQSRIDKNVIRNLGEHEFISTGRVEMLPWASRWPWADGDNVAIMRWSDEESAVQRVSVL